MTAAMTGTHGIVVDIGANDGSFSKSWGPFCSAMARAEKRIHLYIIEPQRRFRNSLTNLSAELIRRWNCSTTFIPAAAWTQVQSLAMVNEHRARTRTTSQTAHLASLEGSAERYETVETVDLANLLLQILPEHGITFVKMDVEGAEYKLLPWLLTQGVLCRVRYLLQEWHLASVPLEKRLPALSMRLALHELLRHGCKSPPVAILHDAASQNNLGVPIPGLPELNTLHSAWKSPHIRTQTVVRSDMERSRIRLRHDGGGASRGVRCKRARELNLSAITQFQAGASGLIEPRRISCFGDCHTERLLSDASFTATSLANIMARPLPRSVIEGESVPCL